MSIDFDRQQLRRKLDGQADAAKKAADLRTKESRKRVEAAKALQAAQRSSSPTTTRSKEGEAERAVDQANRYATEASAWEEKAARFSIEVAKLQTKISKAEIQESQKHARQLEVARRASEQQQRAAKQERDRFAQQLASTERRVSVTENVLRILSTPRSEKLRVLMLGASPQGDLRIGREHTRITRAVAAALHRDQIEIEVRLSATTDDLQEGIARLRPHVVHFSGHGDEQLIGFERDRDERHDGVVVTASAFAAACEATDEPPKLIVLNACDSAATADALVHRFAPAAIGMSGSIEDVDALGYATALYSSIANGQSLRAAHASGKAALELSGGDHDLPYLTTATDIDPAQLLLVQPHL